MMDRKFICTAFVSRIHRLRRSQKGCNLLLRQIRIFAQIAYPPDISHANTPPKQYLHYNKPDDYFYILVNIFTIDISTFLYYNVNAKHHCYYTFIRKGRRSS